MTPNDKQRARLKNAAVLLIGLSSIGPGGSIATANPCDLVVDPAGRNLVHRRSGEPFVWLGDTAWSAIKQLTRAEMDAYLDSRQQQGFTVVQVILIGHDPGPNQAGHWPFNGSWDVTSPRVVEGEDNDYWDNADYFIDGGTLPNKGGYVEFDPPGEPGEPFSDCDWVLVLADADTGYGPPGGHVAGTACISTESPALTAPSQESSVRPDSRAAGYPVRFAPFARRHGNDGMDA